MCVLEKRLLNVCCAFHHHTHSTECLFGCSPCQMTLVRCLAVETMRPDAIINIATCWSMWSRVCVTVGCPSVCLSHHLATAAAVGLLLSARHINRLQRVQNNAARIVIEAPRRSHASPLLRTLHWLPVQQRIDYKVVLLTFKVRST